MLASIVARTARTRWSGCPTFSPRAPSPASSSTTYFWALIAALIGLLLIRTSLRLVKRSHDFLVGAWPLTPAAPGDREADGSATQPLTQADEQRIRAFLLGYPGVTALDEVLVTFVGPGRAWVIARLDIADDLRAAQVKSLVRGIESGMKRESEAVYRVDVVPMGRAQAVMPT